ncbi:MAG: DUF192 domain-containing protein [Rhodospirillales bacterium]|nr:DUF192 domain-containing protein [Rhodospirillales bacterium]
MTTRRNLMALTLALAFAGSALAQNPNVRFEKSDLTIESGGKRHRFTVEFADNDERRTLGLMHRRQMAADAGMLFDFKRDAPVAMWMRNTLIPLDMLFVDRTGIVRHIHERAVPLSEAIISSEENVRAVLELNGGTASRLGLKKGDRLVHAMFR